MQAPKKQLTVDKGEDQHKNGAMDQKADKLLTIFCILACSVLVSAIIDLMFFIFYFKVTYCKFNFRFRVQGVLSISKPLAQSTINTLLHVVYQSTDQARVLPVFFLNIKYSFILLLVITSCIFHNLCPFFEC